MTNKIICDECGKPHRIGTVICTHCGQHIADQNETEPVTLPARKMKMISQPLSEHMTVVPDDIPISLYIRGWQNPIVIRDWDRATLGRLDQNSARKPDLDLSPFGAREKGISRIHAMLQRIDNVPTIIDMNSRNGVYLNGEQIPPGQPCPLHDGDEIHLGELITHLYFG